MHETLRQIPYNLLAIGVGAAERAENAIVASWVMQCSFDPPLIAVALRNDTTTCELVRTEGVFTVNLLDKKDDELARKLVKPQHRIGDKLGQVSHTEEVTGAPVLRDAIAFIECKVTDSLETGDHTLIVGEAVNAHQRKSDAPLACSDIGWRYGG